MLVHPWDAAVDDDEWRSWLADGRDFGQLTVNGPPAGWPIVVPLHFWFDGAHQVLAHLARANPVWAAIEAQPRVVLSVIDDYAFVPSGWRAAPGTPADAGVPTSYYAAVQLACEAEIVDDPAAKARLLRHQLAHFQPAADHGRIEVGQPPYGRLLAGLRGLALQVVSVTAKFKYDDQKPVDHRMSVADRLAHRNRGRDAGARAEQLRRLWTTHRR